MLNIGIDESFVDTLETKSHLLGRTEIQKLPRRTKHNFKNENGHALIISGSEQMMGAAVLAARACSRSGVGLLTVCVPEKFKGVLFTTVPEAMVVSQEELVNHRIDLNNISCIGIGPGLGQSKKSQALIEFILENYSKPLVLDADAINIISNNKEWLNRIPKGSIFTPHDGEFKRLIGHYNTDEEKLMLQRSFSVTKFIYYRIKRSKLENNRFARDMLF